MNLGIERSKVGDIIVEDQKGLIFVKEELAEYIADNLTVVRHTNVNTSIGKGVKVDDEPRFEELKGTVSSPWKSLPRGNPKPPTSELVKSAKGSQDCKSRQTEHRLRGNKPSKHSMRQELKGIG